MSKYSESTTRFYKHDTLEIVDLIPKADGKGMKKPNIIDARKNRFLSSVTSIGKIIANFTLQEWIMKNIIRTCAAYPYDPSTDIEEHYIPMILAKAGEYANTAADRGKEIHKDVENFFLKGEAPVDPISQKVADDIQNDARMRGVVEIKAEVPIGSLELGFAGTPDLVGMDADGKALVIYDLKTVEDPAKIKTPYDSWLLQLGAYSLTDPGCALVSVVAGRESGDTKFIDCPDPLHWSNVFQSLFDFYCKFKKHDPRKAV